MAKVKHMRKTQSDVTACRFCKHYNPEGRRGGSCGMLNVTVEAEWHSCNLAVSPFISIWDQGEVLSRVGQENLNMTQHNS